MATLARVDLSRELKELYRPSARKPSIVDVPEMNFLMLDGSGDPATSQEFQQACGALYGMSYTLKFTLKNGGRTAADVRAAAVQLRHKKNPPALAKVRFRSFAEGKAVQIMYTGPYSEEGPTIRMLHQFAADSGFKLTGKHHEIYIGDPRRAAPEKLKTIIRQPVK